MKRILLLISTPILLASLFIVIGCAQNKSHIAMADIKEEKGFVLMELFTSQGCSSCPPADVILGQYAKKNDAHIIPLAFHVDYWNRLGWVDSFSTEEYTSRQHYYASKFNSESVYTPQIILNGQKEMVGSDEAAIATAVGNFLNEPETASISFSSKSVEGNAVKIGYSVNKLISTARINAALVQADVITQIRAGENRGVKLDNYNVVREFKTVSLTNTAGNIELQLPRGTNTNEFSVVLFIQDDSGKIIAAIKTSL